MYKSDAFLQSSNLGKSSLCPPLFYLLIGCIFGGQWLRFFHRGKRAFQVCHDNELVRACGHVGGCHLLPAYSRESPQVEGSLLGGPTAPCSTNSYSTAKTHFVPTGLLSAPFCGSTDT